MYREGIQQVRKSQTDPTNNVSDALLKVSDSVSVGRVLDVCLNTDSDMFKSNGGFFGLGSITFQDINQNQEKKTGSFAKPLLPFIKEYPLVNEYVLIFKGPSPKSPGAGSRPSFYYLSLKLWNNNEVNPSPDPVSNENVPPQSNKSYQEIEQGSPNETVNTTSTIDLNGKSGGNFKEKGNIHPVLSYAGDRILEGRFGNSIRLGATAKSSGEIRNNWSTSGEEGSPILIFKNGQPPLTTPGFLPITENINSDPSSVYLTSTQKIPIKVSTATQNEGEQATIPFSGVIKNNPQSPTSFNNPQVILNSNRLLFNATTDSILFSSQKSIVLESNEDLGIRSKKKNINILSPEGNISIGKKDADEAVILGTTFIAQMDSFLEQLDLLLQALSSEASLSVASGVAYTMASTNVQGFRDNLQKMLSNKVKVG